jgi:hypothetical protein
VAQRRRVDVDVDQAWAAGRVAQGNASLLGRLPPGRLPGRLSRLQVAARLEPDAHALVPVEHDAARTDHDRRPRDVRRTGQAGERARQAGDRLQQPQARAALAQVGRSGQRQHLVPHRLP